MVLTSRHLCTKIVLRNLLKLKFLTYGCSPFFLVVVVGFAGLLFDVSIIKRFPRVLRKHNPWA